MLMLASGSPGIAPESLANLVAREKIEGLADFCLQLSPEGESPGRSTGGIIRDLMDDLADSLLSL